MANSVSYHSFKKLYKSAATLSWSSGLISLLLLGAILYGLRMQLKLASADLSLSKSVNKLTPDSGSMITYTIVVRNAGPDPATGVEVTDMLPVGLGSAGLISGPGTITSTSSMIKWSNFMIPSNDSVTLSFGFFIGGRGGYRCYLNFAEVSASDVPDPDSSPGNGNIGEDDGSAVIITVNSPSGGNCATCSPAPPNVTIINSTCMGSCMASGGSITAPPGTPCPPGNTIQYQVNGGMWSSTLPVYDQDGPAQTIKTRCNCNFDPTQSTAESDGLFTDPAPAPTLDIVCPHDTTVTCALLVPAPDITSVSASNSCGGEVTITFLKDSVSISDSTCINQKVIYRKYLGMDQCNNDTVCIQKITVRDTIAPMIICPNDTMVACRSEVPVVDASQVMATDNCEGSIFELQASLSGPNESPANASPGFGKAIVTVNTIANTMRVQISFSDLTGTTTAAHIHAATAIAFSGNAGVATTLPSFTGFPSGVTSGTYANTYDMTLAGSYSPSFVTANGGTPATAFVALVAAMQVGKSYVNIHSSTFPGGEIRGFLVPEVAVNWVKDSIPAADSVCTNQLTVYRVFSATDACLNVSYCTQKIVVKDTIGPVFTVFPTDTTVICVDEVPPVAGSLGCLHCPFQDVAPFATDNCGSALVSFTEEVSIDSTCQNKKTILRIWTATDACNNMTRDTQMIRVNDTVPPILTCRDTLRFECLIDFPSAYANVDSLLADQGTVLDNCCLDSSSFRLISETMTAPDGMTTLTRMYSIDDCCGNSDTCVQVLQMPICFLDLALKKEIDAPTPYFASPGGTVPFKISIYNQFAIASDSIKIIDYLPSPASTVISPNWVNNNNGTACLTLSRANGLLPGSGLVFGDSVVVSFTVQLGMDIAIASTQNIAEIYSAQDTFHNTLPDLDSSPNGIPDDETGTVDNEINNDGTLDEDDQDPAPFFILRDPVCHDQLNVSLDGNCQKCITAADLLLGPTLPEESYEIQVFDASGRKLQGNCIDISYLGYSLTYKVILNVPGHLNACWGTLKVEDKAPPALRCANDTVSCFEFANLPLVATNIDNCSGDTVRILSEKWVDYGCDSAYLGYVDRTIWGSDRWQNSLTCTSRIYIKKTSLEQVQCPDALEFPCTILHQIGGVKELKIPISIDKNKLTPEFLLSLQQATWEFKDGSKDRVFLTSIPVVPHVKGQSVYLAASGVCKINASYTDKPLPICGTGVKIRREWLIFDWCTQAEKTCVQYISIEDKIAPIPTNQNLGMVASGPHDCGQYINLPKLDYKDCNDVVQTYSLSINEEGIPRILQGDLPASHIWLPVGSFNIIVRLVDACYNESFGAIAVKVEDVTPPTPVCIEYTQVTVDPAGCWASVAAKDLDKGSRDNCSSKLHFAAAQMDSIDYWTKYWTSKLEEKCGKDEYWRNNELYQTWIDDWIDCYIFRDTVYFDECGSNQVVLRVYEADRIPLRDPHIFPWSEHAWYCYNSNIFYRIAHNYNFFDSKGSKLASWRLPLDCKSIVEDWINTQKTKYISSRYGHNIDVSAVTINQTMDSIQSQGTYCPGDTSINLNPGECNRIVKYSIALPLGYTAVQTSGLPSGSQFPIGTTTNGFNIYDGNTLVTNCTFSVTIKEFDLSPAVSKQMDSIYTHGTYCPGDTTINLNPGECGRIVKYSIILPPGYSAVQTSGLASGYEFPIGTTTNRFNINDGNTLVTNCEFSVTIKEFDMPSNYIYCKENTTIILNNGSAILGAGQVLVNANYGCFDNYIVELFKSGYVPAVLSTQDIGQMYVYRVIDPRTSQKCEGKVLIGTPPLNCKAISTVLLNNDGFAFLGAGQVLIEEQYRCFDNYIVEFLKGSYVPGIATTQDVGMTLTYRVIDPTSSAKCEGKVFIDDINNSIEQLNFLNNRRHSKILYNDCMVTVLVDDKQAPVVNHLQDITIYCDGAPEYAGHPACEHSERFSKWPLDLKDSKGVWHGYYGGSDFLGVHIDADAHDDPDACEFNKGWAPIYCRSWLYLDSFDQAGHVNPKDYFSTLVKVDKKRPLDHVLKSNEFTITDNCRLEDTTLRIVDNGTLNGCSEGWIQRTWTIKDKCGNSVTAIQKIIVKHRSDFEVIFPEDKVVTCDFLNKTDTSTAGAGAPIISDDECEQVGVRYADEIFTVEDGACYKIVRTWTLVDWCIYDPNQHNHYPDVIVDDRLRANTSNRSCVYRNIKDNNDGYMTYVQIIKVIDETPPVVTTRDTTVCVLSDDCLVSVVIPLSASDNCAAASDIRFRYFIDLNATDAVYNGKLFDPTSIDQGGTQYVKDFVFLLGAPGRHVVHVVGIDNCGNADTSSFRFEIKDCKKPTPYCYNGIATVIMPGNGQVTVWAKDLNLNSSDNCTPAADLKYSFSADVATASRQFTCADMTSDGQNQIFEVEIWVTDKAGNQDLCRTYIKLQDNADAANGRPEGACKDTVASLASISGKLLTEDQQGVESATVQIKSATPSGIPAWKSSIDGSYQFNAIPTSGSYSISAMRDDNPMNGVSTLDLVLIQKHILGTERFTSPYKIIAADADNDQNVSAIDLIELRKLILGLYDKLPNNTSWKFVPKSYRFDDILNPWSAPNEEQIIVAQGAMVKDFVGIKIGDVNATAAPHSLMNTEVRGGGSGLILEVKDRTFKAGERVEVSFTSPNFKGISGFQGTMSIGNKQLTIDNLNRQSSINFTEKQYWSPMGK
ncbi:MAG: CHRD domain-containing protein [Saprospiraceae bacterium]|nr:CHRD domain-containing protein [Saprospiraceae bacterium]